MCAVVFILMATVSCHRSQKDEDGSLPANFATMTDGERMAYMMRRVEPDSVARFLCYASLGRVPGAKIDTLAIAYLYAVENYRGADNDRFGAAFEFVLKELSLEDKMHTQLALGLSDTLQVGYELGLGYVGQIRSHNLKPAEIDRQISSFRSACGGDTATYKRFVKGFRTALAVDSGKDLSADIYRKYIDMPEL